MPGGKCQRKLTFILDCEAGQNGPLSGLGLKRSLREPLVDRQQLLTAPRCLFMGGGTPSYDGACSNSLLEQGARRVRELSKSLIAGHRLDEAVVIPWVLRFRGRL